MQHLAALADRRLEEEAQAAGLHASVIGRATGSDFASGELFRIPLNHLREMHESWMPNWIEGRA